MNLSASREIIVRAGNKLAVDIPISKDLSKRDGKQKFDNADNNEKRIQEMSISTKFHWWTIEYRDEVEIVEDYARIGRGV